MERWRVALAGLADGGERFLAVLAQRPDLELVAVADPNVEDLRARAEALGVRGYSDLRMFMVEASRSKLDLLLSALPPHQAMDTLALAAAHGVDAFCEPPPARTVAEGRRLESAFAEAERTLCVPRRWHHIVEQTGAKPATAAAGRSYGTWGEIHVAEGAAGWRGDSTLAGGGVLLHGAYPLIDLLVHWLGRPTAVHADCTLSAPPGTPRKHDTEDFAVLTLRFERERLASLVARRCAGDPYWQVTAMGKDSAIRVQPGELIVFPADQPAAHHAWDAENELAAALDAFVASRRGERRVPPPTIADHLTTLAVIEAAYLSAKTGTPESPAKFLAID